MERIISDLNLLKRFCKEFCDITEKHCKYIIVSGFLAIASGRTRGTEDIDMIIERLNREQWKLLFHDLLQHNFVCMQSDSADEVFEYLQEKLSVRFTWRDKALPEMEVKFSKDLLDEIQLKQRIKLELTGIDVWFGNVNMNIAFKEELLKSPKDLEDALHLRIVFAETVNEEEINNFKNLIKRYRS